MGWGTARTLLGTSRLLTELGNCKNLELIDCLLILGAARKLLGASRLLTEVGICEKMTGNE